MNFVIIFLVIFPNLALSSVKFSGFLDTYFSYDTNSPLTPTRSYTTQATRQKEPQINLAYVDGSLDLNSWRGRIALQYGTSVDANYILEKNRKVQIVQEAFVGKKFTDKLWIDAGVFLGNIGAESWISKYNWTYTRALNLDYVPYYSAGLRFEYLLSPKESIQIQFINGWQNIQENNDSKALGFQYKNELSKDTTLTYNNFLGDDIVGGQKSRFRQYHNFIFKWLYSENWQFIGAIDFAFQSQQNNDGTDGMIAPTFTARRVFNPKQSIAFRAEYYNDRHQTTVLTMSPNGFIIIGASLNYDHQFNENFVWRTEGRVLNSEDKIYPSKKQATQYTDSIVVTSISLSI